MRKTLPSSVVSYLFTEKPGTCVVKLPSLSNGTRNAIDHQRGWTYVHLDEALEMLIVRHLKNLSLTLRNHLENYASWLLQVLRFCNEARYVTGATQTHGRFTNSDEVGEEDRLVHVYHRNSVQRRSVLARVELMRALRFMSLEQRDCA
ncbi:unnamed protein product [Agarophyton chilense]